MILTYYRVFQSRLTRMHVYNICSVFQVSEEHTLLIMHDNVWCAIKAN